MSARWFSSVLFVEPFYVCKTLFFCFVCSFEWWAQNHFLSVFFFVCSLDVHKMSFDVMHSFVSATICLDNNDFVAFAWCAENDVVVFVRSTEVRMAILFCFVRSSYVGKTIFLCFVPPFVLKFVWFALVLAIAWLNKTISFILSVRSFVLAFLISQNWVLWKQNFDFGHLYPQCFLLFYDTIKVKYSGSCLLLFSSHQIKQLLFCFLFWVLDPSWL